ncbi:MAG: hypothetical protein ACP5I2_03410, partial [Fervidicoccaceae archaeon]
YIWTEYFQFKYRHSIEYGSLNIEYLYAVDTNCDPKSDYWIKEDWSGIPISGQDYFDLSQNRSKQFDVTGGYNYDFSVSVSLSYPWAVSVSLGVSRTPAPIATLTIHAGTWYDGYVVRVVSMNDSDYLDSRTFWYKP